MGCKCGCSVVGKVMVMLRKRTPRVSNERVPQARLEAGTHAYPARPALARAPSQSVRSALVQDLGTKFCVGATSC